MKTIQLKYRDLYALVDDDLYDFLSGFKWYEHKSKSGKIYALTHDIDATCTHLHQLVLKNDNPKFTIDHRDGDGLNCQRYNLRLATRRQQSANSSPHRDKLTSKYKGVHYCARDGKFVARITIDGKGKHLGQFVEEKTAAELYNKKALEVFGEFALLNDLEGKK